MDPHRRRLRMVSKPSFGEVYIFSMIAIMVFVVAGSLIIYFDQTYGISLIDVKLAKLSMVGDGQTSDTVHANMVFTVDKTARLLLAGDVLEVELPWSGSGIDRIALKDGAYIISYDGPLLLNEPASAGDKIEIVIRNGGSETAVTATLGAET